MFIGKHLTSQLVLELDSALQWQIQTIHQQWMFYTVYIHLGIQDSYISHIVFNNQCNPPWLENRCRKAVGFKFCSTLRVLSNSCCTLSWHSSDSRDKTNRSHAFPSCWVMKYYLSKNINDQQWYVLDHHSILVYLWSFSHKLHKPSLGPASLHQ